MRFFCLIHHISWIQLCCLFESKTIKASAACAQPSHMYFYSLPTGQNIWLSNGSRISCIDLRNVNGAIDTELGSYIRITAAHLFNLEMFFPWVNKHPLMCNTKTLHEGQFTLKSLRCRAAVSPPCLLNSEGNGAELCWVWYSTVWILGWYLPFPARHAIYYNPLILSPAPVRMKGFYTLHM